MRKFYEQWIMLDPNSALAGAELQNGDYQVDVNLLAVITGTQDFPVEAFFSVPFTHHVRILEKTKIIKQDDFLHKSLLPRSERIQC